MRDDFLCHQSQNGIFGLLSSCPATLYSFPQAMAFYLSRCSFYYLQEYLFANSECPQLAQSLKPSRKEHVVSKYIGRTTDKSLTAFKPKARFNTNPIILSSPRRTNISIPDCHAEAPYSLHTHCIKWHLSDRSPTFHA